MLVVHLDLDAFFFSAELRRRPHLAGRPVVVAGRSPRAVVTTCSYEARAYGVRSGMPARTAARLCPTATFVDPDMAYYRTTSAQVMEPLAALGIVERLSIDEAAIGVPDEAAAKAAIEVIDAHLDGLGLTGSVGVGPTKLIAKLASEHDKPDGRTWWTRAQAYAALADGSPGQIPGIGPKRTGWLADRGLTTVAMAAARPVDEYVAAIGPRAGVELHARLTLAHDAPLQPDRERKSISVERTFDEDVDDLDEMREIVDSLAEELSADARARGLRGRTITVKLRDDAFADSSHASTGDPTDAADIIASRARSLLGRPARPVRLLGLRLSGWPSEPPPVDASDGSQMRLWP